MSEKYIELVLGIWFLVMALLATGCSSQRGWKFEIGVSPISGIHDQQQFSSRQ